MDLCTLHVKDTPIPNPIFFSSPKSTIPLSRKLVALEIRSLKRKLSTSRYRSLFVKATSKKSNDDDSSSSSSSSGDASHGHKPSHGDSLTFRDWRQFRANLFLKEQEENTEAHESEPIGSKWAHPIPFPETGCVLVATEKLDGYRTFARTVVLLLRAGTRNPTEGPFGVVINRPLHKNIKHMKSTKTELAATFSECSLYFGGPLEASMFLLRTGDKTKILPGLEEVMPGLNFGARNSLDEAAVLVKKGILKPQDFRFFVGYAGWQLDQLREEIESDYWHVAACSSDLISGASSENLWEEILQLMGGRYSELSRKPKLDM